MKTLSLDIQGMSCDNCVKHVRSALTGLPDVTVQDVRIGGARVLYDGKSETRMAIVAAVTDEGYPTTISM
jgi:copper chaperone CopZ